MIRKRRGGLYKKGKGPTAPWWGVVKDPAGRWSWYNTRTFDKKEALSRLSLARQRAEEGLLTRYAGGKSPRISEFLPQAMTAIKSRDITMHSVRRHESAVNTFIKCEGDLPLKSINLSVLQSFIAKRREAGRAPNTIHNELLGISTLCSLAMKEGLLQTNPVLSLDRRDKPKARRPVHRALSDAEIKDILEACEVKPLTDLVVKIALNTGLRALEMHTLEWADIDLRAGFIRLKPSKNRQGRIIPLNSHSAKSLMYLRDNYISDGLIQVIQKREPHQKLWVFCRPDGSSYVDCISHDEYHASPTFLNDLFKSAVKMANKKDEDEDETQSIKATFHSLRHTFASNLVRAKVDYYTIKILMGHSVLSDVTSRYAKMDPELLKEAVKRIEGYIPILTEQGGLSARRPPISADSFEGNMREKNNHKESFLVPSSS